MIWAPHKDGFVHGNIGVFPYVFNSWEVWVRVAGEWRALPALDPFKTMEEAQAAAKELLKIGVGR